MGFKSGLFEGQYNTSKSNSLNLAAATFEVCLGSLSYCQIKSISGYLSIKSSKASSTSSTYF